MKIFVAILVLAILLSGCVGVDGQPIELYGAADMDAHFENGFTRGCLASIFFLTPGDKLPPFEQALAACVRIRELDLEKDPDQGTSVPVPVPSVDCSNGNCM